MTAPAGAAGVPLELIVGLGNPGTKYAATRHNVGLRFVQLLARRYGASAKERCPYGDWSSVRVQGRNCRLLLSRVWMNHSGRAVQAALAAERSSLEQLLVVYDELDLPPGQARYKYGGGDAGHRGLQDVIRSCGGQRNFHRLRIGIGKAAPGQPGADYVLAAPEGEEAAHLAQCMEAAADTLPLLLRGAWLRAMNSLHAFQAS